MAWFRKKREVFSPHIHTWLAESDCLHHERWCQIRIGATSGECCVDDPLFGYPCTCHLVPIELVPAVAASMNVGGGE